MKLFLRNTLVVGVPIIIGLGLFIYLFYSQTGQLPNFLKRLDILLTYLSGFLVCTWLMQLISKNLNAFYPWKSRFFLRFFIGFVIDASVCLLILYVLSKMYVWVAGYSNDIEAYRDIILKAAIVHLFMVLIYTLIDLSRYAYRQYTHEQIQQIALDNKKLQLQFQALKQQLNPHFLFNSLNTISSLIYRDEKQAAQFVRSLAKTYSHILNSVSKNLIPLSEELSIVHAYKQLYEIRFEDALSINIVVDYKMQERVLVPPLSIQMLVENAIKHNHISRESPLEITIQQLSPEYLEVRNNLVEKPYYLQIENDLVKNPVDHSTLVGLQNIKKRFEYYTRIPLNIIKDRDFIVQLPVIHPKHAT